MKPIKLSMIIKISIIVAIIVGVMLQRPVYEWAMLMLMYVLLGLIINVFYIAIKALFDLKK